MENLTWHVDADGVALVGIDVPQRSLNILTPALQDELAGLFEQLAVDAAVKGVVLHSAKARGFIAGADLKQLVLAFDQGIDRVQARAQSRQLQALTRRIETLGKPVACAIGGLALGGGLELALAAHYRVLQDSPEAVVGLPEVSVGLLPGGGGTQRLPRLIGIAQALPLMLEGKPVRPEKALALGIVDALAPREELIARARQWVLDHPQAQQPWDRRGWKPKDAATAPFASGPYTATVARLHASCGENLPAPLAIISCVAEGMAVGIEAGLRIESNYFARLLTDPVARNLIRTQFINKGAAARLVRRPAGVPASSVQRLGVVGAGLMGTGIARVAAQAGIEVVLIDADEATAQAALQRLTLLLDKDVARGRLDEQGRAALLGRIQATADYAALAQADLVVEAVFEDRQVKQAVMERIAAVVGPDTVLASNTSTLPITGLAAGFPRPQQVIGLHFFSPVERMELVEVIRAGQTDDLTLARGLDFVAQLRKVPIVVNDSPGFFTSRVFGTYVDEGFLMVREGIAPALVENAARAAGMPVGPLAVADEVSLGLQIKVNRQAIADGLDERFQRGAAIDLVHTMVDVLQRPGRRGGGGFYDYPVEGGKHLWPGLADHWPLRTDQPALSELRLRFLTIQALEAARCVEEGVVSEAADADLGSVLGIGYPAWTGGVLSYIDTRGLTAFVADCDRLADDWGERFRPSAWLRQRASDGQYFHGKAGLQPAA